MVIYPLLVRVCVNLLKEDLNHGYKINGISVQTVSTKFTAPKMLAIKENAWEKKECISYPRK